MDHRTTVLAKGDAKSIPALVAAAENAASRGGLAGRESVAFCLATEEIVRWLAEVAAPGKDLVVHFVGGGWFADVEFVFEGRDLDLTPFNLTTLPDAARDPGQTATGLRIASRMVDTFRLDRSQGLLRLGLTKERAFPEDEESRRAAPEAPSPESRADRLVFREATPDEARRASLIARLRYEPGHFAEHDLSPGRIAARVAAGNLRAAVAVDRDGLLAGAHFWTPPRGPLVRIYGPFLFHEPGDPATARRLFDACLHAEARSGATGIVAFGPPDIVPPGALFRIGSIAHWQARDVRIEVEVEYRQLAEDPGASVWVDPSLDAFLASLYESLSFARERIPPRRPAGSPGRGAVFSTRFERKLLQARLSPLLWAPDAAEVLAGFVAAFWEEGLPDVLFRMDLGVEEDALFAPALAAAGFIPRILLPCAGKGDILVFQHRGEGE